MLAFGSPEVYEVSRRICLNFRYEEFFLSSTPTFVCSSLKPHTPQIEGNPQQHH